MTIFKESQNRYLNIPQEERLSTNINCSRKAAAFFRSHWPDDLDLHERFYVALLDNANQPKGLHLISLGGIDSTVADIRVIIGAALMAQATSIIISHNHPSGKMKPSHQDLQLTRKIQEGCKLFDINLLDHIILSPFEDKFYGFADEGVL